MFTDTPNFSHDTESSFAQITIEAMQAFEVHLNGARVCVAGLDGDCVLSVMVDEISQQGSHDLFLGISGMISAIEEHVIWKGHMPLKVGDEIAVKIIHTGTVDTPEKRYRTNSKEDEENSKAYVLAVAKKYGWKLVIDGEDASNLV